MQAQDLSNLKSQKPFKVNGGLELRTMFYNANGIANRRPPFTWIISGSPTVSIYGWSLPFSFLISKDDRNFTQPFNMYGVSPTYKWIKLHAGYRNVNFSQFTLGGHTIYGIGAEFTPSKLRTGIMYGRLNRATVVDSLSGALVPYSFSRKALALKLGLGSDNRFFDLHYLNASDDPNSVDFADYTGANRVLPAANMVLGYGTKFTFFKKFFIESEGALSLYTSDINSPVVFNDAGVRKFNRSIASIPINLTSQWFTAFSVGAGYTGKRFGLKSEYRRIEPEFRSMGSFFFQNDLVSYTLSPSYVSAKGKVRVNASAGLQRDNVRNQRLATNNRFIGSLNSSFQISERLGLDVVYSNFQNNLVPSTLQLGDSLRIVQTTNTFSIMPRYNIITTYLSHMIMAQVGFTGMDDYNSYYAQDVNSTSIQTQQFMANYNITITPIKLSMYTSITYTRMNAPTFSTTYTGSTFGANKSFFNYKLNLGGSISYMVSNTGELKTNIFATSANAQYQINKSHGFRASYYFNKNHPGSAITGGITPFSEFTGEIAYQYRFGS